MTWVYLPGKLVPPGLLDWRVVQDEAPAFSWLGATPREVLERRELEAGS